MATAINGSFTTWKMTRDSNGDRTYTITFRVQSDNKNDGPAVVLTTSGLPQKGDSWTFGNDNDPWAFCLWDAEVEEIGGKAPTKDWLVKFIFTTKTPTGDGRGSCKTTQVDDPLLEPIRISGGFVKYTEEAAYDRFGLMIVNSAHEQFRGPKVEFDRNRPNVRIEQNVATLQLDVLSQFVDCVNDAPLWGVEARCVKLSSVSWTKKFFGLCSAYYTRVLEFDINFETFDRDLLDEGTKALNGHWDEVTGFWVLDPIDGETPDPQNPSHFSLFKDRNGENCRVILNGAGLPCGRLEVAATPFLAFTWTTDPVGGAVQPAIGGFADDRRPSALSVSSSYQEGATITKGFRYYFAVSAVTDGEEAMSKRAGFDIIAYASVYLNPAELPNTLLFTWGTVEGATQYKIYMRKIFEQFDSSPQTGFQVVETIDVEDGEGETPGNIHVEKYPGVNFLVLGLPTSF